MSKAHSIVTSCKNDIFSQKLFFKKKHQNFRIFFLKNNFRKNISFLYDIIIE